MTLLPIYTATLACKYLAAAGVGLVSGTTCSLSNFRPQICNYNMDSLPSELISRVVDAMIPVGHSRRFPGISLAPYATLDRRWQTIIESCTFSDIRVNTPQRMEEFQRLVSGPRRRSCV